MRTTRTLELLRAVVLTGAMMLAGQSFADEPVRLYAAGSLNAAMTDIAAAFTAAGGPPVMTVFGPSGLLR